LQGIRVLFVKFYGLWDGCVKLNEMP